VLLDKAMICLTILISKVVMKLSYVRMTSKRQVTFPKEIVEKINAKTGDLLEINFRDDHIELRLTKRNILDLMGSVKVNGRQDFDQAKEVALEKIAEEAAGEGKHNRH